jgi:hypothetical protein
LVLLLFGMAVGSLFVYASALPPYDFLRGAERFPEPWEGPTEWSSLLRANFEEIERRAHKELSGQGWTRKQRLSWLSSWVKEGPPGSYEIVSISSTRPHNLGSYVGAVPEVVSKIPEGCVAIVSHGSPDESIWNKLRRALHL